MPYAETLVKVIRLHEVFLPEASFERAPMLVLKAVFGQSIPRLMCQSSWRTDRFPATSVATCWSRFVAGMLCMEGALDCLPEVLTPRGLNPCNFAL